MDVMILRMQAPLMSFGETAIDQHRRTDRHPFKSMVVGLMANALGFGRADGSDIQNLQEAIDVASRLDRPGTLMSDYQTAVLGKGDGSDRIPSFVAKEAWSSRGVLMGRSNTDLTFPMTKDYRADACVTVAVSGEAGLLARIAEAMRFPSRPLFLGRKACLPSREIFEATVNAEDAAQALFDLPEAEGCNPTSVQWSVRLGDKGKNPVMRRIPDLKDWVNGIHAGTREVFEAPYRTA